MICNGKSCSLVGFVDTLGKMDFVVAVFIVFFLGSL